ncbi:MAG TPA: hypothetical protein VGR30_09805 [Candidatus Binatia bacterium]|jgi:hypothetical protein|nr:hypothetical protein [Candidatus Binatia bacterium]
MRTKILSSLFVAILLIFAFEVSAQEQAPAPTFKDGDFWQFRIVSEQKTGRTDTSALQGDYEVFYSGGQLKLFKLAEGEKSEIQQVLDERAVDLNFRTDELLGMLDPRQPVWQYLQFPLSVGKAWTTNYRASGRGERKPYTVTLTAETRATEIVKISTSGGTFPAFKIERNVVGSRAPGDARQAITKFDIDYTYYYSPQTQSIVKYVRKRGEESTSIELIKFGSAR